MTTSKERPILFSGPMVRALLDGSKTQTRRIVKLGMDSCGDPIHPTDPRLPCPYGQPGDRLWVKETWRASHFFDTVPPRDLAETAAIRYEADGDLRDAGRKVEAGRIRQSIFMRRWMSRITLEITGVRVERLQEITSADAIAEGIKEYIPEREDLRQRGKWWECYQYGEHAFLDPRESYRSLWESINGAGSWDANPFVWFIEFRRITP